MSVSLVPVDESKWHCLQIRRTYKKKKKKDRYFF